MELMTPQPKKPGGGAVGPREDGAQATLFGTKKKPAAASSRIERIRARRRARRIRIAALCVLALAGVLAYFTGLYGASLSLLGDVYDSVSIALTPGPGFPTGFSLSGFVTAKPFAGGFVAVGDKDVAMVAANGNEVRRVQHTYSRPSVAVGNTRVCIYNRSGTELLVESRSKNLFQHTFQEAIELCAMSPNGTLAVFTKSALNVYDPMFENIFSFQSSEKPTAMAFAADNRQFAVGCVAGEGGALGGTVYLFTTDPDAPAEATAVIHNAEGLPLKIFYPTNKLVLVVYDTVCVLYNAADGSEMARYDYGGHELQSADLSDGGNDLVLLFGDGIHSSQTRLLVLETANLSQVGRAQVGRVAKGLAATRTGAYVLTANGALCYSLAGELLDEAAVSGKTLAVVAAKKPLLLMDGSVQELAQPGAQKASSSAPPAAKAEEPASTSPAA